ncbi:hypothetical protein FRUB_09884 [Fimbriiglobus ruber]|uniref:DUF1501 domain-containing protein n=1 Tax=Fimbriiglobus ruber TaxID=1908690 RepID=A0A225D0L0_9BACT|nr:hypothetical protein FRUB_09884 [Fimbriiglobus ruber]
MPGLLRARAAAGEVPTTSARRPKSCILLFLLGAPPQQETWDPKPDAPAEVRGDLGVIRSATPGLILGELMPKTARLTEKIAVLRAVQTNDNAHSSSGYYMTTGLPHAPQGVENAKPGAPNDWPAVGAVVRKFLRGSGTLPTAISLPEQAENDGNLTWPGQDAGFLGRAFDPWLLKCAPESARFELPGLDLPPDVPPVRFDARRSLLEQVGSHFDHIDRTGGPSSLHQSHARQAYDLIASRAARQAFDLNAEDPRLRDRYGRYRFGQSVLLARRLVEAGVPLVRVNWTRVPGALNNGHWDTHSKNTAALKQLMPLLDQTYSTLLEDLGDRGLLDDTLVIWAAEFGRTPKINGAAGRDHWGHVFSVALAGGGVRGGTVYGASDKIAAFPKDGIVRPQDLTATIFHTVGVPLDSEITDTLGRPLAVTRGEVIRQIM